MRKLKFRGMDKHGSWHFGSFVRATRGNSLAWIIETAYGNGGWFNAMMRAPVKIDTVGQYTGLRDKNGVEIFEGDIVVEEVPDFDYDKPSPNPKVVGKEKRYWRVRYDTVNAAFVVTTGRRHSYLANKYFCVAVVSNVYENPKLLKETE